MKKNIRFLTNGLAALNLLRQGKYANTRKVFSGTWFMVMLLVVLVAGCNGSNPSLGGGGSVPIVNSTVPAAGATSVAVDTPISATFSVKMDSATITDTTFTVSGATSIAGTAALSADGLTATFTPDADLAEDTDYTATITTGAKSADGVALASNKVWSFTTGPAPTVVSTEPTPGAINVPVATTISATFTEPVTIDSATFTLAATATPDDHLPGSKSLSADQKTVSFTLTTPPLDGGVEYIATLSGVKDLAGNPMVGSTSWSFTTL